MGDVVSTNGTSITNAPAQLPGQSRVNPPQQILVVDDDASTRQLSSLVLLRSGYQVESAEDGQAGWEALQARPYDLLITDHEMPKLSGLDLVKRLRQEGATMPIILASGALPVEQLKQHPWLQLSATLAKPYAVRDLLDTVKQALLTAYGFHEPRPTSPDFRALNPDPSSQLSLFPYPGSRT